MQYYIIYFILIPLAGEKSSKHRLEQLPELQHRCVQLYCKYVTKKPVIL